MHLAAEAELGVFVGARDAGLGLAQVRQNFLGVVADGRDDAHPGDDDPSHACLVRIVLRATLGAPRDNVGLARPLVRPRPAAARCP